MQKASIILLTITTRRAVFKWHVNCQSLFDERFYCCLKIITITFEYSWNFCPLFPAFSWICLSTKCEIEALFFRRYSTFSDVIRYDLVIVTVNKRIFQKLHFKVIVYLVPLFHLNGFSMKYNFYFSARIKYTNYRWIFKHWILRESKWLCHKKKV